MLPEASYLTSLSLSFNYDMQMIIEVITADNNRTVVKMTVVW